MATQPPHGIAEELAASQQDMPLSARELRAQSVQRLQAGLFGLAAIVLVVGLANIINDRARQTEAGQGAGAVVEARVGHGAQTDPLADIGVVPSATPDTQVASAPQGSAASDN
jgi:hypothetical protein